MNIPAQALRLLDDVALINYMEKVKITKKMLLILTNKQITILFRGLIYLFYALHFANFRFSFFNQNLNPPLIKKTSLNGKMFFLLFIHRS